jgi:tetratricopeptide (TPR) repeat protein
MTSLSRYGTAFQPRNPTVLVPHGTHLAPRQRVDTPETTWQALQSRLSAARAAVDAGDCERALAEITAALDIDPNFLAAQSLRDRIIAPPATPTASATGRAVRRPASATATAVRRSFSEGGSVGEGVSVSEGGSVSEAGSAPQEWKGSAAEPPGVSGADLYAKFEQRAKRRRLDRRLDAARVALNAGRLKAAAMALDEVIELDPNLPDLRALTADFDHLRLMTTTPRRGPGLAAAAIFVIGVLAASWLHDSTLLMSRSMVGASPLMAAPMPSVTPSSESTEAATTAAAEPANDVASVVELANVRLAEAPPSVAGPADAAETLPQAEPAAVPALRPAGLYESPAAPPVATPPLRPAAREAPPIASVAARTAPPFPDPSDDNALVTNVLQRYRTAYEGLDAQSAQAVWPAVNQAALTRAFNGLESQTLTFDTCDVRVQGESATATCQGSARYVPKIGSREPRVEPRVWNFTLQKDGGEWKIDSARTER